MSAAMARGLVPNLQSFYVQGFHGLARAALPSFTNPNNVSIVTGLPPSAHGISGNYFFDRSAGEEVMMNQKRFMRASTVLKAAEDAGRKVAVITAKHKLHPLLSSDLSPGKSMFFSIERTADAAADTNGISAEEIRPLYRSGSEDGAVPVPDIYSAEASVFVLRAGAALVESGQADFLYLSTTDYIQHKHPPDDPVALQLYRDFDAELGRLARAGAAIGITADHGMNAKQRDDGSPNVLYLSAVLEDFGVPADATRILLPITDPYVRHHGSLGGFATVYLEGSSKQEDKIELLRRRLLMTPGISECYTREEAAAKLELPADRIGDLCILADRHCVLGKKPEDHELEEVAQGLRSHGARYEEVVPFVLSSPLQKRFEQRATAGLRNFDIFEAITTWVQH